MIELSILLAVFYLYLAILFGYHSYVEARSNSEYASPEWHARRPTEPTHNLCMSVVAGSLALISLICLLMTIPLRHYISTFSIVSVVLAFIFWTANSIHRFFEWYLDERSQGTLPF